jgi:membrane complex biogenesis BtpA family protein
MNTILKSVRQDAKALLQAGFEGVIVENYGDAPFYPGVVPPVTVACMTACALAIRAAAPQLWLGINVLRNDAEAALAIAAATGAGGIRINVHTGARVTDQGPIVGQAHATLRRRKELGLAGLGDAPGRSPVALLCDVDVKHSAPLAARPFADEVEETGDRGLADALLITGAGTGKPVDAAALKLLRAHTSRPIYLASGTTLATMALAKQAYGIIVGSALRADGKAGGAIDPDTAVRVARAFENVQKKRL